MYTSIPCCVSYIYKPHIYIFFSELRKYYSLCNIWMKNVSPYDISCTLLGKKQPSNTLPNLYSRIYLAFDEKLAWNFPNQEEASHKDNYKQTPLPLFLDYKSLLNVIKNYFNPIPM